MDEVSEAWDVSLVKEAPDASHWGYPHVACPDTHYGCIRWMASLISRKASCQDCRQLACLPCTRPSSPGRARSPRNFISNSIRA